MQAKRPTLAQKKFLRARGLNPENWLVKSDKGNRMLIVHKDSGKERGLLREGTA